MSVMIGTPTPSGQKPVTQQSFFSIARQVLAVLALVMSALTQSLNDIHLPIAISTVLGAFGAIILTVEHYVADPSTGNPTS
jgi:hypothetical protein